MNFDTFFGWLVSHLGQIGSASTETANILAVASNATHDAANGDGTVPDDKVAAMDTLTGGALSAATAVATVAETVDPAIAPAVTAGEAIVTAGESLMSAGETLSEQPAAPAHEAQTVSPPDPAPGG